MEINFCFNEKHKKSQFCVTSSQKANRELGDSAVVMYFSPKRGGVGRLGLPKGAVNALLAIFSLLLRRDFKFVTL